MNEVWERLKTPPEWALKKIGGGRLKGMTDIAPQWRYHAMTEEFGLCGVGWKYEVEDLWTEPGDGGQTMAFAKVQLYFRQDGEWSAPIPGVGGNMLVVNEKNGPHTNDEGFKMALTDALSVAMKMIGAGAAIYYGEAQQRWEQEHPATVSADQLGILRESMKMTDTKEEDFCKYLKVDQLEDLLVAHHNKAMAALNKKAAKLKGEA